MTRAWKIAFILAVILLLGMSISLGWSAPQKAETQYPAFTAKDRESIDSYYTAVSGRLAPGSIDRSTFSLSVEKSLVPGARVPPQLEKNLKPLPAKLEAQLSQAPPGYLRYRLGHHILLVRKSDMILADIVKNVAVN